MDFYNDADLGDEKEEEEAEEEGVLGEEKETI